MIAPTLVSNGVQSIGFKPTTSSSWYVGSTAVLLNEDGTISSIWWILFYMSIDETIGVFAEVLRPVRDGGQDGAHQQEDDGHDDQDDVAVRCNIELKLLRR